MKNSLVLALTLSLLLASCGRPLQVNERTYPTYGFLNESNSRSKNVCYEVSIGNVIWSVILFETIIAPIYFIGWSLFNPIRMKLDPDDSCSTVDG